MKTNTKNPIPKHNPKHNPKAHRQSPEPRLTLKRFHSAILFLALLVALGSCFLPSAKAGTSVCGLVENEIWTPAGSPYFITCDVQVDSLYIQPGVVVQFQSNYVFQVTGFLVVTGTVAQPILFTTTNSAVGWQGMFFNEVLPLSKLDHCTIEGSENSGVRIKNSIVEISNCLLRNNSASQGGGINIDNTLSGFGELLLSNCTLSNNTASVHGGAVRANMGTGNNSIRFACCSILNNTANPAVSGGNYVGGGLYITGDSAFNNCLIAGNVVRGCAGFAQTAGGYGGGLYFDGAAAGVLKNCVVTNNSALGVCCGGFCGPVGYGGGIYQVDGTLTNINCIIAYNTSTTDGSGVYVSSGNASIENCTIAYNSNVGLRVPDNTTTVLNSILFFNNSSGTQATGTTNIFYSCVQNGDTNNNNIVSQPSLNPSCLRITFSSPCKDKGDPDPAYNDVCIDDVNSCAPLSRGTSRNDMGAHGGRLACCWDCSACTTTVIQQPPQSVTACVGASATFCIGASGPDLFGYQWRFHGTDCANLPTIIPDATNSCYTISNVQSNNAGYYSVVVSGPGGAVVSSCALLTATTVCLAIDLYAGLTLSGRIPGQPYSIQSVLNIQDTNWMTLATVTQTVSGVFWLDPEPATHQRRFYRAIPAP